MQLIDFKIVYLIQVCILLVLIYLGRNILKKKLLNLFGKTKIFPLYLFGFRLLLGLLLLERLYRLYYENILFLRPTSFFRINTIFEVFFNSDYRLLILILIPLIFVGLFIFEWKPRLTATIVFLYSVIGGTFDATISGSLGKMQHSFHMTALMLLGFAFYYWVYHKRNGKGSNEWIILPILLFFVATIYGSSFMSKMSYLSEVPKWFTGEAVQSSIVKGHFERSLTFGQDYDIGALSPIPRFVANNKPIAALLGIGVLLTEFSSLLLLIVASRLRLFILASLTLFNVGAAVLILAHFHFSQNIIVLLYIVIWAAYNAFPNLWFHKRRKT